MKIDRKVMSSVRFKDVKRGDVFIDDEGDVCMKTERLFENIINAVTLDSGDLFSIKDDDLVWLPNSAKLIVKE